MATSSPTSSTARNKKYLKVFHAGIYRNFEAYFCETTKAKGKIENECLEIYDFCWTVSAEKFNEGGKKIIKIEAIPDNRYDFPHKRMYLTVSLFENDLVVYEKKFELPNILDKQNFVINADQEGNLAEIFEDIKMKVGIYLRPDGYVSDLYGTESIFTYDKQAHDAILLVGDKKFYVIKKYLSTWSNYFNNLFSKSNEGPNREQKLFHIEGVDAENFELLMNVIHPDRCYGIDDESVHSLLKLAHQFEMPSVKGICSKYLQNLDTFPQMNLIDRFELADKYKLISLQACILRKLHSGPLDEYEKFKADNKDRIKKLSAHTYKNIHNLR